jgi:hypothetical protein
MATRDLTLDAGVLIQLEKGDHAAWARLGEARHRNRRLITVPAAALAQAWRGKGHPNLIRALQGCELESMSPELARAAGTLCGLARTTDVVDAAVMASAASRGDTVLTTDYDDLARLAQVVPTVRVIGI